MPKQTVFRGIETTTEKVTTYSGEEILKLLADTNPAAEVTFCFTNEDGQFCQCEFPRYAETVIVVRETDTTHQHIQIDPETGEETPL